MIIRSRSIANQKLPPKQPHTTHQGRTSRFLRALTGRDEENLVRLLQEQLSATSAGAELVSQLVSETLSASDAHERMRHLEHDGDAARGRLIAELAQVLRTPIDSEDLFRLSRSIDDVLDNLRDFVREVDLFRCTDLEFASTLVEDISVGLRALEQAIAQVLCDGADTRSGTLGVRKASNKVRMSYQTQLADLFSSPVDSEMLKRRELLRRLDIVGLRLSESADALADGALKRSR